MFTPMEVEGQTAGVKRPYSKMVDPDDQTPIAVAKKSRVEPDKEKKVKVLKFIAELHIKLHSLAGFKEDYSNISLGNQVASVVFTVFVINKQKANGISGNAEKKSTAMKTFTITSMGTTYTIDVAKAIQAGKDVAATVGLEFKKYDPKDPENWYGTAAPYLDFFCANNLRLSELRLGHSCMPIAKENGTAITTPVVKYGLDGSHHVLLEGSSYPPEKRSSMAQSVGPMTALLCHIRTEERYRQKWTDAAKRSMMHVPFIDEVLEVVKNKKASEIGTLIRILADIVLITGSRQAHRMSFPLNMFVETYTRLKKYDLDYLSSVATSSSGAALERELPSLDKCLEVFNVSGRGGYFWYRYMCKLEWAMEGNMTDNEAKQILFHSVFGTFKEDLSILAQVTDQGTWNTREDFNECFRKMKTCGKIVKFSPIKFRYYSKLSAANQTGLFASKYTQTCAVPVFSGRRTQHFSEEFFEQIGKRTGHTSAAKTVPQLIAALTDVLSTLREDLVSNGKKMRMGTVEWREMASLSIMDEGNVANVDIVGTNKFFLGSNH